MRCAKQAGTVMALLPSTAFAAVFGKDGGIGVGLTAISQIADISKKTSITEIILTIIAFILELALLLAVVAIIVAGIYLIVSNGDEGQKDKAKKIITYAIIGILVILLARVIILFVVGIV